MGLDYPEPPRDPLIEQMRAEIRSREAWDASDAGRLSGISSAQSELSNSDTRTDRQIVEQYLRDQENERAYGSDSR